MTDEGYIPKGQVVKIIRNRVGERIEVTQEIEAIVIRSTGRSSWNILLTEGPHRFKHTTVRASQIQPKIKKDYIGLFSAVLPKGEDGKAPTIENDFLGSRNIIAPEDVERIAQLIEKEQIAKIAEEELFGAQNAELQTCK